MTKLALGVVLAALLLSACSKESEPPPAAPLLPPEVLAVHPPARTIGAAYDTDIWVTFESALDPATVNERTVFLKLDTRRISSAITLEDGARRIRIAPREELLLRRTYTVEITGNVQTLGGGSFGETFFWQFTTNSLRHVVEPVPAAGARDEPPAAGLSWRPNDAAAGPVTYEVFSGLDSAAVASYAVTPRVTNHPYVLSDSEWPMDSRVYWTVRARHNETQEVEASPVWAFNVLPPGMPIDSITVQAFDAGYFSRRSGRWLCSGCVTGPDAQVSVVRFNLDTPILRPLKLQSATMVVAPTTLQSTDPGLVIQSMDYDLGCGSAQFPTPVLNMGPVTLEFNRFYCSSIILASLVQSRFRGVPVYGFIPSTSRTVTFAGVSLVLRYYRVPPPGE